jgi:hypothetical protein
LPRRLASFGLADRLLREVSFIPDRVFSLD